MSLKMKIVAFLLVIFPAFIISTFCPDKCICLWYANHTLKINCSGSEKTKVPFNINPQVTVLDLSHNEITAYSHSKYLKVVEEIDLSNNQITEVSFGGSFKHLKSIDLSHNSITHLKKIDIRQLKALMSLNLSYNFKLHEVSGLKSECLEELDVSHCDISFLNEDFMEEIPRIRFLNLSFNYIRSLKNVRSKSLQRLDASHLKIEALSRTDIFNLPNLTFLNVSFNPNLKMNFFFESSCWDVKNLDLSNSKLTYFDDLFPFCSLQILNASSNHLEIIEMRTFFNNRELNFVDLSHNRISEIQNRAFYTTEKLKILDLSSNQIQNVAFTFYLKETLDLNLSNNQILSVTDLMLKNALQVNLSHNKITEVWLNLNENAPKLKTLNLSYNKIKHLSRITSKSIRHIDLSYSAIESIDVDAFINAENLAEIILVGNTLSTLDFRLFRELSNLNDLALSQNPWSCNCLTQDFKELYQFLIVEHSFNKSQELTCTRTNKTWRNSCQENWRREKEYKKTLYILIGSLSLTVTVVAVVFLNKYLHKNRPEDQGGGDMAEENERQQLSNFQNSSEVSQIRNQDEISESNSTPPPDYEIAIMLPKITEHIQPSITRNSFHDENENEEIEREDCLTT